MSLQTFLDEPLLRRWSSALAVRQHSPYGVLERGDLFVADLGEPPSLLLVDGDTGPGREAHPRRKLFAAVTAAWPGDAGALLSRLGEQLPRTSAVHAVGGADRGEWHLAEVGGARAFLLGADGRGTTSRTAEAGVRSRTLRLQQGKALLLLSDGGYELLRHAGWVGPTPETVRPPDEKAEPWRDRLIEAFESAAGTFGAEDATLILFDPFGLEG
jgi:hypothetical protein